MKKTIFTIGLSIFLLIISSCNNPKKLDINTTTEINSTVYIYVNSIEKTLEGLKNATNTYIKILDPIEKKPDGIVVVRIAYDFTNTENLLQILSELAKDKIVYGQKTMLPIDKTSEQALKTKSKITLQVSLIPVALLNDK